jgi:hypothetical protein
LLADHEDMQHIEKLVGHPMVYIVKESGGKFLLTNQEIKV